MPDRPGIADKLSGVFTVSYPLSALISKPSKSDSDIYLVLNGHIMSSTIAAAYPASQMQTVTATPPESTEPPKGSTTKAPAQASVASAAGSSAQQQAALNRMLATYARDQSRGTDAGTLSNLGKQIMTAAKAIGQHVTLPHAPAGAASATPAASAVQEKGKVNVTA
jgi:hypothetical protein